ncbi:hypothetical protein A2482_03030 [Candidatus Falkowbacteria bacterium RIFOXYC2_FULL_48_21]|uniref:PRC-barrel domain-containing protein n=1 Tax=Candidatus Falkowbacteria bacterium RIFOXYC2_FULL_48_21 TaxID=1798005 RepID=A0A1F5T9E1_9BACT|nr:MAG: hypothetical protein A2482_03030 [Candidatus Falkowbacteria bacterium RIFOXYC2_FULL_48_21]
MRIAFKQLKALPVFTESGLSIGRVVDIEIDVNNHGVGKYIVSAWPAILKREKLFIAPDQIVAIDSEKVIVRDGAVKVAEPKRLFSAAPAKEAATAVNAEVGD